jgi:hypothetical protein
VEVAAQGKIVSSSDGGAVSYGPEYAKYGAKLPGTKHTYINTGALCLDVVRHWELVGLWAFASKYGAYSPGAGAPLGLPGHGDQGVFNAVAALLGKTEQFEVLPEGVWCDSTKGCTVRIRSRDKAGRLTVWNEAENKQQRLVHSSGPKWWTDEGVRHLQRFGEKLACFRNFAETRAALPELPARVEPLGSSNGAVRILVGICSCRRNGAKRQAVRDTWLRNLPSGVAALFYVGEAGSCDESGMVCLPAPDDYQGLVVKVHAFYRYALSHYQFDYLFKCDDDTYLHAERLLKLPRDGYDFIGSIHLKSCGWASGGAGYLMSRAMVERLVAEPTGELRGPEDVYFSRRARASGLAWHATEVLHPHADRVPELENDLVTAHWCGTAEMRRIHAGLIGEPPAEPLLSLSAKHPAWKGWIHLCADGVFLGGAASPNGTWVPQDDGKTLLLQWDHWPVDALRRQPWGFEGAKLRLEFIKTTDAEQWDRIATGAPDLQKFTPTVSPKIARPVPQRFGVFKYDHTPNLGDEIQSVAASRLLPQVDYYIEREEMHRFEATESVFLLANGWYIHNCAAFPPADRIRPFYISVHFTSESLFSPAAIAHLKEHGPIGCRDPYTLRAMRQHGIEAYVSGCLTMTLEPREAAKRTDAVYIVDVNDSLLRRIPEKIRQSAVRLTHAPTERLSKQKFAQAGRLLELYATARLVITGRLHCALPCLALKTPVVLLHPNRRDRRFGAIAPFLPVHDAQSDNIDWQPGSPDVAEHARRLRELCRIAIEAQDNPLRHDSHARFLSTQLEKPWVKAKC